MAANIVKAVRVERRKKALTKQAREYKKWISYKNHLKLQLEESKLELSNLRTQIAADLDIHTIAMARKDEIIEELHGLLNVTESERYVSNAECVVLLRAKKWLTWG